LSDIGAIYSRASMPFFVGAGRLRGYGSDVEWLKSAIGAQRPFLVLHLTVQIRRMQLEEKVLQKAFPEYATYARRTPRLIPGVW
jgi:protein-S-isoprenylcysteine O-methyltransferase Ste14